uniref:Musculin n=1 Tax=Malurus cyaneus samueli TaxID=2593467 RepID=A0A8C5X020_9PASS
MSTGSGSEAEELPDMDLRRCSWTTRRRRPSASPAASSTPRDTSRRRRRRKRRKKRGRGRRGQLRGGKAVSGPRGPPPPEGKQSQRNAANARERARMRVLSKAFSRLKTSLPWVPPDTKLSKLDTLRLASSYIAHLRQLLQEDRYENSYVHPVNLTWPFVVSGRPDSDTKEVSAASRLCGTTA